MAPEIFVKPLPDILFSVLLPYAALVAPKPLFALRKVCDPFGRDITESRVLEFLSS